MADSLKKILAKLTPGLVQNLDDSLGNSFYEAVALCLIDELSASDMPALTEVLKSGDIEALEKFLRIRIPNMDRCIAEALAPAAEELQTVRETAQERHRYAVAHNLLTEDATHGERRRKLQEAVQAASQKV